MSIPCLFPCTHPCVSLDGKYAPKSVTLNDFMPFRRIELGVASQKHKTGPYIFTPITPENQPNTCDAPRTFYQKDETQPGAHYRYDGFCAQRVKFLILGTWGLVGQSFMLTVFTIRRIANLLLFAHFWRKTQNQMGCSQRVHAYVTDLAKVLFAPLILVGFELTAIYGLFAPISATKIYGAFERLAYGHWMWAPCMQPKIF